ncbi:MAG: acyl-CoA dehydrogenase family protein [Deltaproteobacteria bacterium]|nr:acyl-CoA dehydrogenase family protein [Deltaproteobacteria bacterium]MBW2396032.1 acyl-CoA dehydrogenase family protein [Deltaproteobacteria bacterium]
MQSEDQELIAKTAADFVGERSPIARVRALRDAGDPVGFSRELWKEMADLGWVGIPFAEVHGGADLGLAELTLVVEALGRGLAPEPFLSTVLLAGQLLQRSGDEAACAKWLPGVCSGDTILALAYQGATSRYEVFSPAVVATAKGDGFLLTGQAIQVLDGHVADALIVSARTSGEQGEASGLSLFVVPKDASGLEIVRQSRVDDRNAALVQLSDVAVSASDALAGIDGGGQLLQETIDRATIGLCAEMLGGMQHAFELTLEHLKTREQFETVIGTFQALKHRAADLFIEIELSKSAVMAAARAADGDDVELARYASLAKAQCSEAYVRVTNEAVQMFGGVGMTDEYDIGFYMKRARATELTFGDAAYHRDRWAALGGY